MVAQGAALRARPADSGSRDKASWSQPASTYVQVLKVSIDPRIGPQLALSFISQSCRTPGCTLRYRVNPMLPARERALRPISGPPWSTASAVIWRAVGEYCTESCEVAYACWCLALRVRHAPRHAGYFMILVSDQAREFWLEAPWSQIVLAVWPPGPGCFGCVGHMRGSIDRVALGVNLF